MRWDPPFRKSNSSSLTGVVHAGGVEIGRAGHDRSKVRPRRNSFALRLLGSSRGPAALACHATRKKHLPDPRAAAAVFRTTLPHVATAVGLHAKAAWVAAPRGRGHRGGDKTRGRLPPRPSGLDEGNDDAPSPDPRSRPLLELECFYNFYRELTRTPRPSRSRSERTPTKKKTMTVRTDSPDSLKDRSDVLEAWALQETWRHYLSRRRRP